MAEIKEMQEQIEALRKELDQAMRARSEAPKEQKLVFTPKQRKLEKFSGKPGDAYANVYEFIEEIQRVLKTRPTPHEEQVDYLIGHLEGPAKEEVRYRSPKEKSTPKKVLHILRESFGERATTSELMAEFYQTRQSGNQSLHDFSHLLMKKLDKVARVDESFVTDKDQLLRNQFAENVADAWLKRELKKSIRAHPTITFSDIREEAIVLAQDRDIEHTVTRKREVSVYAESAESDFAKIVSDLKGEVAGLRLEVQELRKEKGENAPVVKKKLCYHCKSESHIKRNCPDLNGKNLSSRAGR